MASEDDVEFEDMTEDSGNAERSDGLKSPKGGRPGPVDGGGGGGMATREIAPETSDTDSV